jgi:hypothetical protein
MLCHKIDILPRCRILLEIFFIENIFPKGMDSAYGCSVVSVGQIFKMIFVYEVN